MQKDTLLITKVSRVYRKPVTGSLNSEFLTAGDHFWPIIGLLPFSNFFSGFALGFTLAFTLDWSEMITGSLSSELKLLITVRVNAA